MKAKKQNRTCGNCSKWNGQDNTCRMFRTGYRPYDACKDGLLRPTKMFPKMDACPFYFNY